MSFRDDLKHDAESFHDGLIPRLCEAIAVAAVLGTIAVAIRIIVQFWR